MEGNTKKLDLGSGGRDPNKVVTTEENYRTLAQTYHWTHDQIRMLDPYHFLVYLGANPKKSSAAPSKKFELRRPPGFGKAPKR